MALHGNTGTAAAVHLYLCFWEGSFYDHGIGDHANVGTKSAQLDLGYFFSTGRKQMGEFDGSKSRFIYSRLNIRFQFVTDFPAGRVLYAVRNRKFLALLGVHIICAVGIPCKNYLAVKVFNFIHNVYHNVSGVGTTERSGDEVVLHIYNNQKIH